MGNASTSSCCPGQTTKGPPCSAKFAYLSKTVGSIITSCICRRAQSRFSHVDDKCSHDPTARRTGSAERSTGGWRGEGVGPSGFLRTPNICCGCMFRLKRLFVRVSSDLPRRYKEKGRAPLSNELSLQAPPNHSARSRRMRRVSPCSPIGVRQE